MTMKQEETWNKIAEDWSNYRVEISPTVLSFLKNKKGKILDLGCGSGRNFVKINGLKWHAIDFSEDMIKFAEKRADKLEMKILFKQSSCEESGFENNYFDCVLCYSVLHCIDSPIKRKRTLEEIFRVLKPGKEALISSWGRKSPRIRNKSKECFVPWAVRKGEGKQVKRYTYIFELDELIKLAEETGFEIISAWEERNVNLIVKKP